MQVIVNKSGIEQAGNKILELSDEYNDKIKDINNILSQIESCWNGDDATIYIDMMHEKLIPNLEKIKDIIEKHGNYLKKIPEVYYRIDSICLEKSNNG